jgi:hypothetical protein
MRMYCPVRTISTCPLQTPPAGRNNVALTVVGVSSLLINNLSIQTGRKISAGPGRSGGTPWTLVDARLANFSQVSGPSLVSTEEPKYVESWPNTTFAWAGWSRFDIPVDRYGGVHSLLQCTGFSYLPLG